MTPGEASFVGDTGKAWHLKPGSLWQEVSFEDSGKSLYLAEDPSSRKKRTVTLPLAWEGTFLTLALLS